MKPVALFRDPFREGDNVIVLCDTWTWKDKYFTELVPANTNFRYFCNEIMKTIVDKEKPWFGIEQEYTLL